MDSNDVSKILEVARNFNSKKDITGMLLYIKKDFLQILEGNKEDVLLLYDSIKKDDRHDQIRTLISCYGDERLFNDWSMGYSHFDNMEGLKNYAYTKNVDLNGLLDEDLNNKVHPSILLLKTFYFSRNNEIN